MIHYHNFTQSLSFVYSLINKNIQFLANTRAVVAEWVACWIFSQTEKISFGGLGFELYRGQKFRKNFNVYIHLTQLLEFGNKKNLAV